MGALLIEFNKRITVFNFFHFGRYMVEYMVGNLVLW